VISSKLEEGETTMPSRTLYTQIVTEHSPDELKEAVRSAFRSLGGTMMDTPSGISVRQGVQGVSFAFTADVLAHVNLREIKENKYEIECQLNWSMNALSWICLVVGFFVLGILWIVPLLFLFLKPEEAYLQALNRVQIFLE
jgi:hypothetical protein